jgi:fibro-slime domain-containing protein
MRTSARDTLAAAIQLTCLSALTLACGSSQTVVGAGGSPGAGTGSADGGAGGSADGGVRDAGPAARADGGSPAVVPPPAGDAGCASALEITVRDFTEQHPDFEHYTSAVKGIVQTQLGPDSKPVYAPAGATSATTSKEAFDQWYRDVDGVNQRVPVSISFTESSPGVFVYDSSAFFPIDGQGFGNGPAGGGFTIPGLGTIGGGGGNEHNFLFTTEAHTRFSYRGGEVFTFRGDDDLWVFINGQLAVDLGGTHVAETGTVDLDAQAAALGIAVGKTYAMDIFHAERHTSQSNYRIETTIDLSCIENVPVL